MQPINDHLAAHPGSLVIHDWRGGHPIVRYEYSIQANDILHAHGLSAAPPRYTMGETV